MRSAACGDASMRRLWIATVTLICGLVVGDATIPRTARADSIEQLVQGVSHPTDRGTIVLRYESGGGGIVLTRDGGASWQLLCSDAIASDSSGLRGAVALAADGSMHAGTYHGLYGGSADACRWTLEPALEGLWIRDITGDPRDPAVLLAVSSMSPSLGQDKTSSCHAPSDHNAARSEPISSDSPRPQQQPGAGCGATDAGRARREVLPRNVLSWAPWRIACWCSASGA